MRWLRTLILFSAGGVVSSQDWAAIHASYVRSIENIDHPEGTGRLTLRRRESVDGKLRRNGVGYLRRRFLDHIVGVEGWRAEGDVDLAAKSSPPLRLYPSLDDYVEPITSEFGGFDLVTSAPNGLKVAIEWETGNISSSHRSMNKLGIALETGIIGAGVLIVPSRALYQHLTDRIGNIAELSGYLQMWQSLGRSVSSGLLAVSVVEHDLLTSDPSVPYLPMGDDGNAARGRRSP